jgi:hypothetical protein
MSISLAILKSASWLVPCEHRAEWLAEWSAEVWYVRQRGDRQATCFCLGAFRDALWIRRNSPANAWSMLRLESPMQCLGFLALMAAACVFLALRLPGPRDVILPFSYRGAHTPPISSAGHLGSLSQEQLILAALAMIVMALVLLPSTTALTLGEYPADRNYRRWVFFTSKVALLLPIVFFVALDLWAIVGIEIRAHCMLFGYVVAFRWALMDQRQRCPECLRLLACPARIGRPSQTFLDWYGTEFVCMKGHGLLHVPEIPTISFETQRWLHLDQSWSVLFSKCRPAGSPY